MKNDRGGSRHRKESEMEQDKMLQLADISNSVQDYCESTRCGVCLLSDLCDLAESEEMGTLSSYFRGKANKSAIS